MTSHIVPWLTVGMGFLISVALAVGGFGVKEPAQNTELTFVARDMAFHLGGRVEANPEIHLPQGGRLILTLRNDDQGIQHELRIPALGIQTQVLEGGEEDRIELIPKHAGTFAYFCELHPEMMRGTLIVAKK